MTEGWKTRVAASGSVRGKGQSSVSPKEFMRNTHRLSPCLVTDGCNLGDRGWEPPGTDEPASDRAQEKRGFSISHCSGQRICTRRTLRGPLLWWLTWHCSNSNVRSGTQKVTPHFVCFGGTAIWYLKIHSQTCYYNNRSYYCLLCYNGNYNCYCNWASPRCF